MKKKLLVFCVLAMAIMCLFAISASAAETINGISYDLSNGVAKVNNGNKSYSSEIVIIPETVIAADGKEYTVKEINTQAFQNNKTIKYVSLPSTITYMGQQVFAGCTSIVFVDFNGNTNKIKWNGCGMFDGCSSLKAICLPDGLAEIPDQTFRRCTALTAVYLPASLTLIKGNKSAGDGPAFGYNSNMFFVNEKFDVVDQNGDFYTAETFPVPQKPEVYFMPSGLKSITGSHNVPGASFSMDGNGMTASGGGEDCGIYQCTNLNKIIVMPSSYQGFDDRTLSGGNAQYTDFRGDTIDSGLFQRCGTSNNPLTVVFLGKIDRLSMGRKGEMQYTTFVFANSANTGFENTKIGTWYNTSDSGYQNQNEMYVVFCHANNGEGAKYKVGFSGSADNNKYPVLTTELQSGAATHIVNTKANVIVSNPTCTLGTVMNTFCFCGKEIDTNKEIVGTALGHEYDLAKGAVKSKIEYANYLADGKLFVKCARCTECQENKVNPIITEFKGFSVSEKCDGITFGYTFDNAAISEFEEVNSCKVELGFVVAVKAFAGSDAYTSDKAIKAAVTDEKAQYTGADFVLRGTWDKMVDLDGDEIAETDVKNVEFYMAGYILVNGTATYLNSNGSGNSADVITFTKANSTEA